MPRRVGVYRPRPATAYVPYPEFELGPDQVCPTPEILAHLRAILHAPSTTRSQEVLAHWTDQLGAWLAEREERERIVTAEREEREGKEREATAEREERLREEKVREERETTARDGEGPEVTAVGAEVVGEEDEAAAETRRVDAARALEPPADNSEDLKPSIPVISTALHHPYALAPIEVASLEIVPEVVSPPEPAAPGEEGGPSTEE